jgi:hypothetical protein
MSDLFLFFNLHLVSLAFIRPSLTFIGEAPDAGFLTFATRKNRTTDGRGWTRIGAFQSRFRIGTKTQRGRAATKGFEQEPTKETEKKQREAKTLSKMRNSWGEQGRDAKREKTVQSSTCRENAAVRGMEDFEF